MLAKKTAKNQLTLPKEIVKEFPGVDYFDVRAEEGRIVLEPLRRSRASDVRRKLAELGITESDVADAIEAVRKE